MSAGFDRRLLLVLLVLVAAPLSHQLPAARAAALHNAVPVSVAYLSGRDVITVSATGVRQPNGTVKADVSVTSEKAVTYILGFQVQGQVIAPWWRRGSSISTFEVPLLGGAHVTLSGLQFSPGSRLTITADKWAKYLHGWMSPTLPMGLDFVDAFVRCTTGSTIADFMNHGFANTAAWDLAQGFAAGLEGIGVGGAAIATYLKTPNKDWKAALGALLTTTSSHPKAFAQLLKQVFHLSLTQAQLSHFVGAAPFLGCVVSLPELAFDLTNAPQLRQVTVTTVRGQSGSSVHGRANGWPTNGIATAWLSCDGRRVTNGTAMPPFPVPLVSSTTTIKIGPRHRSFSRSTGYVVGFALYRRWTAPHWIDVEAATYSTCISPWHETGEGRGAYYRAVYPFGNSPAPGRYYLALLWAPTSPEQTHRPLSSMTAQLSLRAYQLPMHARPHPQFISYAIELWGCFLWPNPPVSGIQQRLVCKSQVFDVS